MQFWTLRNSGGAAAGENHPDALPFDQVWTLQKALVELRARDEIEDTFLFLEHRSVVTRGRGLQWTGVPRERAMPLVNLPAGTDYFEIERGGDLTWHGPGQLVLYPIVKLDGKGYSENHDVTGFLRRLERATIGVHARYGLQAESRENAAGVWVGESKTTSVGIAVRRWVTFHGVALNTTNSLQAFSTFSPCGFQSEVMASLESLVGNERLGGDQWRDLLEKNWQDELMATALHPPGVGPVPEIQRRNLTDLLSELIMKA